MSQMVRFAAPRQVTLVEYDDAAVPADGVRIATLWSGISAGSELTAYRGTNPYVHKRWDADRRLFVDGDATFAYPVDGWGYEEVGRIVETGEHVERVGVGDVVAGIWGHRSSHVADAEWAAARILPAGLDPKLGIFARIGAIALNAVHDAAPRIGDVVAVFGQGVPGLIVTQLLAASGATVIAVDGIARRLHTAATFGADHVVDFTQDDPAERIKHLTGGIGADVSIEISGSSAALHSAIRATAYNSRVVAAGFFQGDGIGLRLGEEFHHNRASIVCSQISGVAPDRAHRWNATRLERTFLALAASGRIELGGLVSHTFAVAEAAEAFALLDEAPGETLQVVLEFDDARP